MDPLGSASKLKTKRATINNIGVQRKITNMAAIIRDTSIETVQTITKGITGNNAHTKMVKGTTRVIATTVEATTDTTTIGTADSQGDLIKKKVARMLLTF